MPLPAPSLDDRDFQSLVDEAKRLVQQRCPEWSDHNVSDPGVTLIETFAFMTDQLLYRLNQVPDRLYVKFLDLMGVRLFPPSPAHADVTFWLSAPQPEMVRVPRGTEVATVRTEADDAVGFVVTDDLAIVPTSVAAVASLLASGKDVRDHTPAVLQGRPEPFHCFDDVPQPGDALLIGLTEAAPRCAVALRFTCDIQGHGVDPDRPPLVWEAWDGTEWCRCDVEVDETGGLNRPGDLVLHIPPGHAVDVIGARRGGWLRARVVDPASGLPAYSSSPRVTRVEGMTVGGTATASHAEHLEGEVLGLSEGFPGQVFASNRRPLLGLDGPLVVEVAGGSGWQEWHQVDSFAGSGPRDRHVVVDATAGLVQLGPAVRLADGSMAQYGAVPAKGAPLRLRAYRTGGGARGNVAAGTISVLRSSLPYVTRIGNRRAATGGVDGETVEEAKLRGPLLLRARDRAVTAEDYEHLARAADPAVARAHCLPASVDAPDVVRVLVVPSVAADPSMRLRFGQLVLTPPLLERLRQHIDERRTVGARVVIEPPSYQGVTAVARLRAAKRAKPNRVEDDAMTALHRYLHPLHGGPLGDGWPFGRPLHVGEVFAVLQALPGVEYVVDARLFAADAATRQRGEATQRVPLEHDALFFSVEHQIRVDQ